MYFGILELLSAACAGAAMDHGIAAENGIGRIRHPSLKTRIKRSEWLVRFGKHLLKTVDHEIGLLIRVDAEFRIENALEIKTDAVRYVAVDGIDRLALRRQNAGAERAQALRCVDEAEFDRVPVEPRQQRDGIHPRRSRTCPAILDHVIGKDGMREQRHMAEEVMEHVRLFEIVEFAFLAYPPGDRKAPIGQMLEEFFIGDQAGNGDDLESRQRPERLIDAAKIRNSAGNAQMLDAGDELLDGIAWHQRHLMPIEPPPAVMFDIRVVIEGLFDRIVGCNSGVVAPQLMR